MTILNALKLANKFYLTVSSAPSGELSGTLTDGKESETTIPFTCPSTQPTLECTLQTPLAVGSYKLKELVTSSVSTEELIYTDITQTSLSIETPTSSIASLAGTQNIEAGNTSFTILLGDTTNEVPKIYIDDESNPVTCTRKQGDQAATIECPTTDETMPPNETSEYNILYKGFCMTQAQPTDVKVKKTSNPPPENTITVSKMSLSSTKDTTCSSSGIAQVVFTADKEATGTISGGLVSSTDGSKTVPFSQCNVAGTTITCSVDNVTPDEYILSTLQSNAEGETINVDALNSVMLGYLKTLGTNETPQEIEYTATSFTLNLFDPSTNVPNIYYPAIQENANKLECTLPPDSSVLQCNTNENMANAADYEIYYVDECSEFLSTGMTIRRKNAGPKAITISSISIGDSQCVTEAFTSLTVTLSETPATTFTITLTDATNTHTFNFNCASDSTTPTCTIEGTLVYGVYKATGTTPSDTFTLDSSAKSTELKYYGKLGAVTSPQVITSEEQKIKVALADSTATPIKIFYVNNGADTELRCDQSDSELQCNQIPDMEQGKEYTIRYSDPCNESAISNANIIVKLPDAQKTIKPTAMTITEGTTETCTPITSVDITVDTPLGKTAYTATFTN